MRKLLLLTMVFLGLALSNNVQASNYTIDEQSVDQLFDNAATTSMLDIDLTSATAMSSTSDYKVDGKDPLVAIILDIVVGGFGVHRFYLGTEPISGIAYFLTCGGFGGVVPIIDLIVLAIHYEDISAYVDNPYFFMWKDTL